MEYVRFSVQEGTYSLPLSGIWAMIRFMHQRTLLYCPEKYKVTQQSVFVSLLSQQSIVPTVIFA